VPPKAKGDREWGIGKYLPLKTMEGERQGEI
jgi:hypothetical protein